MSSRICGKCGSNEVVAAGSYAGSSFLMCETCGRMGMLEKFPKMTVFHKITVSPKALAPKLVYFDPSVCDDDGIGYPWCSTLFEDGGHFETEKKAIAATVAKLKEVCNE